METDYYFIIVVGRGRGEAGAELEQSWSRARTLKAWRFLVIFIDIEALQLGTRYIYHESRQLQQFSSVQGLVTVP